jgi:membrane protease YdiL (CAAX protease family)
VSQALRWRVPLPWYAFALLGPLALWLIASCYVAAARSFVTFDLAGFALFVPLVAKHFALGGGLGEELGWRGFLQSTLERGRSVTAASLGVGVVWGLWHAPVFLLPTQGRTGGVATLLLFTALCVAYSLIFARVLHGARGSLLIVALLHAATNAAENAVKNGFPDLRGGTTVTLVYAGLVLALAVAAIVVKDFTAPQSRGDSPQPG